MKKVNAEEVQGSETILLTVSWGKEVVQPLQYHSIEIGPFQMTKKVNREDAADEAAAMYEEMEVMATEQFEKKIKRFFERVKRLNSVASKERGR